MDDPTDRQEAALLGLRSRLQTRILAGQPALDDLTTDDLWRSIKRALSNAYDQELLATSPYEIHAFVPKPSKTNNKVEIHGGLVDRRKPFARKPEQARIKRSDGAWLHFTLTLECLSKSKKVKRLWAYDFELVFPAGHSPSFVRFDLNEPGHPNEAREVRSHMHPGNDDLLLPAPVMSPEELIDVLIRRLRTNRSDAKPRG